MRGIYLSKYILLFFMLICASVIAQDINDVGQQFVNNQKLSGQLTGKEQYTNRNAGPAPVQAMRVPSPQSNSMNVTTACNCWIDRDATWSIAQFDGSGASGGPGLPPEYRNDDWSTVALNLPFNFCFYGQQINSVFINNNGNISIGTAYSTFTASSFPSNQYTMVAPFWADVDTRDTASGIVYYKIEPTYMIVQWEEVGYFNVMADKVNTFQLIITDGNDPIINIGQNVAFCYKDMQWTTGSASGGTNGFGGTPATVGVNQGNGTDYIQFGMFDAAGNAYDGPYGLNDGVDWLDGQSFVINACVSSANIPPVLNTLTVCDTIRICENTTYTLTANYLAPEQTQTTTITYGLFGMQGVNVISNTAGNTATLVLEITGSQANLGFHTISMTASDNGSPAAGTTNNFVIEVLPAPMPAFTFLPTSPVQTNTAVAFTNTSPVVAGAFYQWNFGDSTPPSLVHSPSHTYTAAGTYTVSLQVTYPNGCILTVNQLITVTSCAPATITVTDVCVGTPSNIAFTSTANPGAVFTWNFSGGTIVSGSGSGPYTISWNTPGSYTVSLDVTDPQCSSTVSMAVNVNAVPVASITPVNALCAGDSPNVNFNGTAGAGATYTWNFGSGSVTSGSGAGPYVVQYNTAGNDAITLLVDENGCVDSTQINVVVNPVPTSPFTIPPAACANDPLVVTYTGNAGAGANYTWNFDNGIVTSGSGQGPYTVSWATGGSFNLTLTVEENGCISQLSSMPVTITDVPVVSISNVAPLCEGSTTNVSLTGTAGPAAVYTWNFGNATVQSGSGAGPYTLQYATAGQEPILLSVTDNNCTSSDSISVTINPIPTSLFAINNAACINQPIGISYTGSATANATYTWTFGSANVISGSGQGPYSLSWNSQGSYQISLVVTENGCVSPQTDLFANVNPLPVVNAGSDQASCSGIGVPLGDVSTPGFVYLWSPAQDLNDPTISNPSATIQNNTNNEATRDYILMVTDANGCINYDTVEVATHPVPVIGFPNRPGQCLETNSFNFSATSNLATGMNYNWSFAGPASVMSAITQNVTVSYTSVGNFQVLLTGDYNGCPALPFAGSVDVYAMPVPDFNPLVFQGCRPLTVPFSNLTPGTGNTYNWVFGDGGTDVIEDPIYTYNDAGIYSVALTARTTQGCTVDTIYKDLITVFPDANASYVPNPPVANILAPTIQFQNLSTNAMTYLWDFGDSTAFSTDPEPDHRYTAIGTYEVTLMVVSPNGCVDTVRGIVRVEENFSFYIPNAFTPNGDGINDIFRGYGVAIDSYNMNIYNRWGELIFKTNDYETAWDGRMNDNPVQNDTYVYRIELVDLHGEKHTYVGDVSVVY